MNDNSIKDDLKKRRKNGGCGMWKNIGIHLMYKNYRYKLSKEEIDYYEEIFANKKKN